MAATCPVGFDVAGLRAQIHATYDRVARDPSGDFHFHRGARYATDYLRYSADGSRYCPTPARRVSPASATHCALGRSIRARPSLTTRAARARTCYWRRAASDPVAAPSAST
jgi:hypothetical protein